MVEPHSSNFRVITTNVLGVRIFRKFTVASAVLGVESVYFFLEYYSVHFYKTFEHIFFMNSDFLLWKKKQYFMLWLIISCVFIKVSVGNLAG